MNMQDEKLNTKKPPKMLITSHPFFAIFHNNRVDIYVYMCWNVIKDNASKQ